MDRFRGGGSNLDMVADIVGQAMKLLRDVEDRGNVRVIQAAIRTCVIHSGFALPTRGTGRSPSSAPRVPIQIGRSVGNAWNLPARLPMRDSWSSPGPGPASCRWVTKGPDRKRVSAAIFVSRGNTAANPVIAESDKLVIFRYFFTRKLTSIRHSDAVVLFPGSFGTMDEAYETLTLLQTGKSQMMPLILIDRPGSTYWKHWASHVRDHLLRNDLISKEGMSLITVTDDLDHAVRVIRRIDRDCHSARFVNGRLVIRLQHAPTATALEALNEDFSDIVTGDRSTLRRPSTRKGSIATIRICLVWWWASIRRVTGGCGN